MVYAVLPYIQAHPENFSSIVSKQPSPALATSSDSASESDVYMASRRKASKKKPRRPQTHAESDSGPTYGEVRFSTRRAAKVSNYNEDDEDMFEEEEEEANGFTPNYCAAATDQNVPAIDAILNHRLREGLS